MRRTQQAPGRRKSLPRAISTRSPEYQALEQERRHPFWKWGSPPRGNKKPLWKVLEDGAWKDIPTLLIGGGPSVRRLGLFNGGIPEGMNSIVCNKGFLYFPTATMMIAMDADFYRWLDQGMDKEAPLGFGPQEIRRRFYGFPGLKVWIDPNNNTMNKVYFVYKWRTPHIVKLKQGVFPGNNIGVGALMMAGALRANPIYLAGYDFYHEGKRSHFHSGYAQRPQHVKAVNSFIKYFHRVKPEFKRSGLRVYNLNPKSRLRCFPFASWEDVKRDFKPRREE